MFTPIYLLPQRDVNDQRVYRRRWQTREGQRLYEKLLSIIREGIAEDLLIQECDRNSQFLDSPWDLKGLYLQGERIEFADEANFKRTNFSYARFYKSVFKSASFDNVAIEFATIHDCEFVNCCFDFTSFYGVDLQKTRFINCDFLEYDNITNCDLIGVEFVNCFIPKALFFNCRFDELTRVSDLRAEPNTEWKETLDNKETAEIYKGIKEAYRAGQVVTIADHYFLKERQAVTRYNRSRTTEKLFGYFLEFTAGYGIRPSRVLLTMIIALIVVTSPFMLKFGISDGFLIGAGAFFTFGANTDKLQTAGPFFKIWYVTGAFLGLCSIAFFVTVLANKWLNER